MHLIRSRKINYAAFKNEEILAIFYFGYHEVCAEMSRIGAHRAPGAVQGEVRGEGGDAGEGADASVGG
jgi:hypothetical protein